MELIEPDPDYGDDTYLGGVLAKYGARIHHITLKIPDLEQAVVTVRRDGIEPIDINMENTLFHEAFIRPNDGGGMLVQLLWTEVADHEWENDLGLTVVAAPDNGAELTAVRLRHPDREEAALLWTALGAEVSYEQPGLIARWPESSLTLQIEPGEPAGPLSFVFSNAPSLPAHPRIGPAVQGDR